MADRWWCEHPHPCDALKLLSKAQRASPLHTAVPRTAPTAREGWGPMRAMAMGAKAKHATPSREEFAL
eukprot:scaffold182031_cov33-Tisochrysis_lutea.AAC.4